MDWPTVLFWFPVMASGSALTYKILITFVVKKKPVANGHDNDVVEAIRSAMLEIRVKTQEDIAKIYKKIDAVASDVARINGYIEGQKR